MIISDLPNHTDDFKGFLDWKCTNCGNMFHQQYDCDVPQCPECVNEFHSKGKKYVHGLNIKVDGDNITITYPC